MSKKEYFAYGSNLNFEQMAYRCPEQPPWVSPSWTAMSWHSGAAF